jgi:hypothetical protein
LSPPDARKAASFPSSASVGSITSSAQDDRPVPACIKANASNLSLNGPAPTILIPEAPDF